jgi:DNA-binding transcriptional ArsR family regulator
MGYVMRKIKKANDDDLHTLADIFRLLGDVNRLKIITTCLDKEKSVGDLAEEIGISQPLVSHHLRLLKAARLVRHKKQGKQGFYALSADHVRCVLVDMLHHVKI